MVYRYTRAVPPPPDIQDCDWSFEMGESVQLMMTGETGFVSARKEEIFCEDQYEITYVNTNGCLVKAWWPDAALEPINLNS